MANKQTSFPTVANQVIISNKNIIEILGQINTLITTESGSIDLQVYNNNGVASTITVPSFKSLKDDIERLNNNINSLYGLDASGAMVATTNKNDYKKIITVNLNKEPSDISSIGKITTFTATNNWFFDSLTSPMLEVEIDLSNKIDDDVRKVLSRRYIVDFDTDSDGNFTTDALNAIAAFNNTFRGVDNILISDFEKWYTTTAGIKNPSAPQYDEQIFDLEPNELEYEGTFNVLSIQDDRINAKMWYVLESLDYLIRSTNTLAQLSIGDYVITNTNTTSTKYKIVEVSTSESSPRIRLERIEGISPISVGINTLKIYSNILYTKKVKISIGYGERDVIFLKPINADTNLLAKNWSYGTGFLVSDLIMNAPNTTLDGMQLDKFYTDYVYDYGMVIKDMVAQKIPSALGVKPTAPTLNADNFKVVQINKHLTNTTDSRTLKQKHNYQTTLKSELTQIDADIISKNNKIAYNKLSESAQTTLTNEISELNIKKASKTKLLTSLTSEIVNLANSLSVTKVEPKYRIRGFWNIPEAIKTSNTPPQEVVQFKVQYKYLSKDGSENNTEMFKQMVKKTTATNTTASELLTFGKTYSISAAFSNWNEFKTDARTRVYNKVNGQYEWQIEDVQDADTPNINQLDIPIQQNEKVQIRIKSLSEVGYPDAPQESDWSEIMEIEFPDDLNNVLDNNDYILKAASADDLKIQMNQELSSKGIDTHLADTTTVNSVTYFHNANKILSGFKDSNGVSLGLFDYLTLLQDRIAVLEEKINNAKGVLEVVVCRNDQEFVISNGSNTVFNIECEDYLERYDGITSLSGRCYANNIYVIKDFVLKIKNTAVSANLGLNSNRTYLQNGDVYNTSVPQTFWVNENDELITSDTSLITRTQIDNQFIWAVNYDGISDTSVNKLSSNIGNSFTTSNSLTNILSTNEYNIGYNESSVLTFNGNNKSLLDAAKWIDNTISISSTTKLLTTIHPVIKSFDDIVETNSSKIKTLSAGTSNYITIPINIYFKMNALDNNQDGLNYAYIDLSNNMKTIKHIKKIKFFLENEADNKPFTFTLTFNINRSKVIFQKVNSALNKNLL